MNLITPSKIFKSAFGKIIVVALLSVATQTGAQDVRITEDLMEVEYDFNGKTYVIHRNQDQNARVIDKFAKTSRPCPRHCIQPMSLHKDVETVGELELLAFVEDYVSTGKGFLIDSRGIDDYRKGTIPGAVNLPSDVFLPEPNNVFFDSVMNMLSGEKSESGGWVFNDPKDLLLFCNGSYCSRSPKAVQNLLAINYPPEKLHWYRGGMQNWVGLGFVTEIPK